MRIATQKEALPNDIESLIRRLGQELSCSICLSVFEDPTMTPCNHTFCRECIERAVSLTKKDSSIPCNQCPICKSKTPKRSLNPSPAASKLCQIYEEIVRSYSEIRGGNGDWVYEAGIRGNDAHYDNNYGGIPLDNLSQLYPYPEKPVKERESSECDFLTKVEEEENDNENENETQMDNSRIYDENTQLECTTNKHHREITITTDCMPRSPTMPSSQLVFEETQLTGCTRLMINTQELEKLAAINDSIDKELAELEKKLAATREEDGEDGELELRVNVGDKENCVVIEHDSANTEKETVTKTLKDHNVIQVKKTKTRIIQSSKPSKSCEFRTKPSKKKIKTDADEAADYAIFDPVSSGIITGITTTGIKDEKSQIQLAKFSDKFNFPISPDFQDSKIVSHLLIPTTTATTTAKAKTDKLIVKKRTMKYFEAILLKKEIISFDWVEACLKAEKILSTYLFKIKGDEIGIERGYRDRVKFPEKIFANYKFYLYGEFRQPPRDQLENLIKATAAPIITKVQELSRGTIVLADPSAQFTFEKDAQIIKKYPIVGTAWLLDSISCGRALEFHGYFIL